VPGGRCGWGATHCTYFYCHGLYLYLSAHPRRMTCMRIAKPILLVTTPLGVAEGFYECYRLAGGLVVLMVAMVGVLGVALATVVATIRREASAGAGASAAAKEEQCRS
jgi:hypothetical protein